MNYLSLWIANLGVVPWFSFLFFLFFPIFLSLRVLLVLVCVVLEAISYPFAKLMHLRTSFLSPPSQIVKRFMVFCFALSLPLHAKDLKTEEFFLAKGEQVELQVSDLASFSIGNKEVLTSKFYAAKGQLLVKGNSLGFSDLVIWSKSGEKSSYHFYVVSKREQLTNFQLANDFKSLGLEVKALAFELLVRGEIKNTSDLALFNLYMNKNKERVINMVELSHELKKEVVSDIYLVLADEEATVICSPVGTSIECLHNGLKTNTAKVQRLASKYSAKFFSRDARLGGANFKVELKVLRTDESYLKEAGLGLDKLSARVGSLLNGNLEKVVEDNNLFFSEKLLNSRIVTSPALLTSLDSAGEIQMGAEIPVVNQNQYGAQSTTWKFAGLKLKTKLSGGEKGISVRLESELTHPVENLIRGSKSSTEFFPKLGEYSHAFQVKYKLDSDAEKGVPGISKVPLLGALFSSGSENSSVQYLVGYLKVTRMP